MVNFVVMPAVAAVMFVFLSAEQAVRIGVLLVLLTPCVDYVIVFSGLAGGSNRRLLAATPLLLIAQMLLLPGFLYLFLGPELADFVEAFVVLILIPLALAWATRAAAGRTVSAAANTTMVPLMAATILVVVASQVPKLGGNLTAVAAVVPFYVVFLVVMAFAGGLWHGCSGWMCPLPGRWCSPAPTRNSLVVLPLALALPDRLALAAAAVVTQTLVEVLGMVAYVRLVSRLVPTRADITVP